MSLSEIDRKILLFVCLNGLQMPEKAIARQLRLKPSTVAYSLKKMQQGKVILGWRYRLNYTRLGLSTIAWVFLKVRTDKVDSFQLIDELLRFPQVHVSSFVTGEFDVAVKVIERNVSCIDVFVRAISQKFSDFIEASEVVLVTKSYKAHNIVPREFECMSSLDETDLKILGAKMQSPAKSFREIASQLGLHRNTVSNRWKSFWKKNVLLKKTPVVNPSCYSELGISLKAIVLIDALPQVCDDLAERMLKMSEVHELNRILGRFSLMVIVRTADIAGFLEFIKWVLFKASPRSIKKTVSIIVLKSKPHKANYLPQLLQAGIVQFKEGKLSGQQNAGK